MVFFELFWSFCKIGFTSFGGLSMVPLINSEMVSHGWMSVSEVSDIVAMAEITPGPLGLNCATFAGTRVAGFLGAICASLGVLSPTFLICAIAAVAFEKFRDSSFMQKVMTGVRPICLGLILGVLCSLALTNYASVSGGISLHRCCRPGLAAEVQTQHSQDHSALRYFGTASGSLTKNGAPYGRRFIVSMPAFPYDELF